MAGSLNTKRFLTSRSPLAAAAPRGFNTVGHIGGQIANGRKR